VKDGDTWRLVPGEWIHGERTERVLRDRDGDGVPNRMDGAPDNPVRQ
jgi:hypothetical protein